MKQQQNRLPPLADFEQSPAYLLLLRWLARINQRRQPTQSPPEGHHAVPSSSKGQSRPPEASEP